MFDPAKSAITRVVVASDTRGVPLCVDGLQARHVHEMQVVGVRSAERLPLLHDVGHYTLNYVPAE